MLLRAACRRRRRQREAGGVRIEVAPFQQLDREFTAANGFEAKITVGKVEKAQCPAVDMLARIGARERGNAPRIELARDTVRLGDILTGTLEAGPARYLDLILVRDDGTVQSMLPYVKTKSPITFGMPVYCAPGASKPQLLVAVSSDKPLPALDLTKPAPADKLFAALQKEISAVGNVSIGRGCSGSKKPALEQNPLRLDRSLRRPTCSRIRLA